MPPQPWLFASFGDLFTHFTSITPPNPITVPWFTPWCISAPEFIDCDDDDEVPNLVTASPSPSSAPSIFSCFGEFAFVVLGLSRKPTVHVLWEEKTPITTVNPSPLQSDMAFRLVDPEPFMPLGAQRRVVNGRPVMRRVVIGHVAQQNNDVAIANLHLMPQGPINFMAIHNVIEGFLRHRGIGFRSMQSCPFGQAYVRFNYILQRDLLIAESPHQFGNGSISFLAHNHAWNNRTALMTHEVWIMLLGLNLDLWTQPLLDKAVSSFGRLLIWEEDLFYQSRAVVKVRVSSLEDIPWFFVFTEGIDFESESWSVQCEILQARMLGGAAADEQFPLDDDDFDTNHFEFHGFGQQGQGPPPSPEIHAPFHPNLEHLQAVGWEVWPNPNEQPVDVVPDLVPISENAVPNQEEQLPAVDEVVQAEGHPAENPIQLVAEHVLAMDDNTDESEVEPQMPPLIDDLEVGMPDFPNLQNLQPLQVEEVQLEDLVDFNDLAPNQPLPEAPLRNLKIYNWALCRLLFLLWTQ